MGRCAVVRALRRLMALHPAVRQAGWGGAQVKAYQPRGEGGMRESIDSVRTIYYNREPDAAVREGLRDLDSTHRAPLSKAVQTLLTPAGRSTLEDCLEQTTAPVARQGLKVDRGGRFVASATLPDTAQGDERRFTPISTVVSEGNLVEPLFTASVRGEGTKPFEESLRQLLAEAQRFIFVEAFEFERPDLTQLLLDKARHGVNVMLFVQPPHAAPHPEWQEAALAPLRQAVAGVHIVDYAPPASRKRKIGDETYEAIQHTKKIIADRPHGGLGEISGGINFGRFSDCHVDTATYTEGPAALDSLRRFFDACPQAASQLPAAVLAALPQTDQVAAAAAKSLRRQHAEAVVVEMGASGKRHVEVPRLYSNDELRRHAAARRRIVISAQQVAEADVSATLIESLACGYRGSWVTVVVEPMGEAEQLAFARVRPTLRRLGALIVDKDACLAETSYAQLVYRELNRAAKDLESIEAAAYCLTDLGVLQRLVAAKTAGCPVRVVVDALRIEGELVNKKALMLLTQGGVEVRVCDQQALDILVPARGHASGAPHLHTKNIILNGTRVLAGSANFTKKGLSENMEDGRLVRSVAVAQAYHDRVFEPAWRASLPVVARPLVAETERTPLVAAPPLHQPIDDTIFAVLDLETTGFSARYDERIVALACQAVRLVPERAAFEVVGDYSAYVQPGRDLLGEPFAISKRVVAVHGLSAPRLAALGARPWREVAPQFVEFLQHLQGQGAVVLAGQNVPFDLRFLDQVLEWRQVASLDGVGARCVDAPYVDTQVLSKRVTPLMESYLKVYFAACLDKMPEAVLVQWAGEAAPERAWAPRFTAPSREEYIQLCVEQGLNAPSAAVVDWVASYFERSCGAFCTSGALQRHLECGRQWAETAILAAPQRHNLDAIGERFLGLEHGRGLHSAAEDVALTARALATLLRLGECAQLQDALDADRVDARRPLLLSPVDRVQSGAQRWRLEAAADGALFLRDVVGFALTDRLQRVQACRVVGLEGDQVRLQITTGSGRSATTMEAFADARSIAFRKAGPCFYALREKRLGLKIPPRPSNVAAFANDEVAA